MNILAIDCCLRLTGIALMLNDEVVDSDQQDLGRTQTEKLPLMTQSILERNDTTWENLDYIALTNGPGYFTGIRVGAAYASGIAYAAGKKIISVSPLEVLVRSSGLSGKILAVVYAGHGYVYAWCDKFLEAGEYKLDEISEWLTRNPDAQIISDDPIRAEVNAVQVRPNVESLCEIARERLDSAISPQELRINYYRAPQGVN